MSRRTDKVGDQLQAEIADLLHRQVKHPVLNDAMLSITRVEVDKDFARARIFVSIMGADRDDDGHAEVIAALERTEPFLHRGLVKRLRMRRVPRLTFIADFSIAEGDRVRALMRSILPGSGDAVSLDDDSLPLDSPTLDSTDD
jgi:ribosome-binding factor A